MAIKRVHEIAIQENQPIISNGELRYEWSDGEMNAEYELEYNKTTDTDYEAYFL